MKRHLEAIRPVSHARHWSLSFVVCCLHCVATEATPSDQPPLCQTAARPLTISDSVVQVRGDLGLAGVTLCSGVLVAPRLVLTNLLCLVTPSRLVPSDLAAPPPDDPDFGAVIHSGDIYYAEYCQTDAGWSIQEDGTLEARLGEPLDESRLTVVVRRDDRDLQMATVRRVQLPNAESRCWDTIAALVLEQPLDGAYLPVRLQDTTAVGEQVVLAGFGESSVAPYELPSSIEAVAFESPSANTPPRSVTLKDQICRFETGGPLASTEARELIGVVAFGTGTYCGDPNGRTIATRAAPFRRLLLAAAEAAEEVLQTVTPVAAATDPPPACLR